MNKEVAIKEIRIIEEIGVFPVARSQAKRLYKQFECVGEVILDFEDISDMGQGFAHELFVVYGSNHPEVKLTTINESESVKRMIYHVTH